MSLLQGQLGTAPSLRTSRVAAFKPVVSRAAQLTRVSKSRGLRTCQSQTGTVQASTSNGAREFAPLLALDGMLTARSMWHGSCSLVALWVINPPTAALADKYEANHAVSSYANWLIPGTLLVGRYPYVEPSRCKTYEKGEKQLEEILKAGVTTFISLQVSTQQQGN